MRNTLTRRSPRRSLERYAHGIAGWMYDPDRRIEHDIIFFRYEEEGGKNTSDQWHVLQISVIPHIIATREYTEEIDLFHRGTFERVHRNAIVLRVRTVDGSRTTKKDRSRIDRRR